jgi:predicted nucleic-acid-binding protein
MLPKKKMDLNVIVNYLNSDLFKKQLEYAKKLSNDSNIYIISAKYHLVPLNKTISPYNLTLKDMPSKDREAWAEVVLKQLQEKGYNLDKDKFILLAGNAYRQYLVPQMKNVEVPLEGLRIGQQKKALLQKLKETIIKLTNYIIKEVKKLYKNGVL